MRSRIYHGEVVHARAEPVKHSFRYPVYFFGLDLSELDELAAKIGIFGYNRVRPVAIHDKDYLKAGSRSMRAKLEALLAEQGVEGTLGRVMLITSCRHFNYVFNPASFFYCFTPENELLCIVVQVNNTFGDMHLYLLRHDRDQEGGFPARFESDKVFHVSPFFDLEGRYEFELNEPLDSVDITIRYYKEETLRLVARLRGEGRPLTRRNLLGTLLSRPLQAALTIPRIHWHAARLYLGKKLGFHSRPSPSSEMTVRARRPSLAEKLGMKLVLGFLSRVKEGRLKIRLPDGATRVFGSGQVDEEMELRVRDYRFFGRVMLGADIGFGEAYTEGMWDTPDLAGLLTLLAQNSSHLESRLMPTACFGGISNLLSHLRRGNTLTGARRNISEHYDLSNEFFGLFLDRTMTYSCGIFPDEDSTLEQAQLNKLRMIADKARIGVEDRVLEIGCGWGGFAIETARRTGCGLTGITISNEQLRLAETRAAENGLQDRVEFRFLDYRRLEGRFDKIVSIEMLEAVGKSGLPTFFEALDKALKPGGRAVIQVITIADHRYRDYSSSSDWIRKHIFPGGHLPSVGALRRVIGRHTSLSIADIERFGGHYARTLSLWRETFVNNREPISALGFDETFFRKWIYYFSYCEAGFRTGNIDLVQLTLDKSAE